MQSARTLVTVRKLLFAILLAISSIVKAEGPAPAFELPTLNGETFALDETRGKLVYLDFWASWCGPCKISFPDMVNLQAAYDPDVLQVVAISVDKDIASVEKFIRRYPANFTVLHDQSGEVAAAYAVPTMPASYLIDRRGNIKQIHAGYRPGDMEAIKATIAEMIHADD